MEYLQYICIKLKSNCCKNQKSFKPYYKWNTFNTKNEVFGLNNGCLVLNLIINGIPSILQIFKSSENTY